MRVGGGGGGKSHQCQRVSGGPGKEPEGEVPSVLSLCLSIHNQINRAYYLIPTAFPPALGTENDSSFVNSFAHVFGPTNKYQHHL